MKDLLDWNYINFFFFNDSNLKYILFSIILLNGSSAIIGSFIFLKKKSLVGDALSHSILPGICIAFIILVQLV